MQRFWGTISTQPFSHVGVYQRPKTFMESSQRKKFRLKHLDLKVDLKRILMYQYCSDFQSECWLRKTLQSNIFLTFQPFHPLNVSGAKSASTCRMGRRLVQLLNFYHQNDDHDFDNVDQIRSIWCWKSVFRQRKHVHGNKESFWEREIDQK